MFICMSDCLDHVVTLHRINRLCGWIRENIDILITDYIHFEKSTFMAAGYMRSGSKNSAQLFTRFS